MMLEIKNGPSPGPHGKTQMCAYPNLIRSSYRSRKQKLDCHNIYYKLRSENMQFLAGNSKVELSCSSFFYGKVSHVRQTV